MSIRPASNCVLAAEAANNSCFQVFLLVYTHPIHALIQSANHVAAAKRIKSRRHRSRTSVNVEIRFQIGEKCGLSGVDHGMIIGVRRTGLSISLGADLTGFPHIKVL